MFMCYLIQRMFPEYLFGELSPNKLKKFNKHIQTCQSCYFELQEIENTARFVQQQDNQIDYPLEPDWEQFTLKLNTRLAELKTPAVSPSYTTLWFNWLRKIISPQPTWATSLAAVATIILLIFQGSIISGSFLSLKTMKTDILKTG